MSESTRVFSPRPATAQALPPPNGTQKTPQRAATGRGEKIKPSLALQYPPQSKNPFEWIPPHSEEIEKAVLGCMLREHLAYEIAVEMVTYSDFYIEQHQRLFSFFKAVYERLKSLDEILVNAELKKSNREEMRDYVGKLIMAPTSAANVEGYCNELLRYSRDRKRLTFALRILKEITAAMPAVARK